MKQCIHSLWAILIAVVAGSFSYGQALIYEYDAGQDPDGGTDALWEHNIDNSALHGGPYNRDFTLSNVIYNATPSTNYSGITAAYTFNGTNSSADTTNSATTNDRAFGAPDLPLGGGINNAAGASATIEIWLRPNAASLSNINDQILFESGGATNGLHLAFLNQPAGGVDLEFRTRNNTTTSGDADVLVNLTNNALLDDFLQIVGVIDPNNPTEDDMRLYVNGASVGSIDNWKAWQEGNNNAGVGSVGAGR